VPAGDGPARLAYADPPYPGKAHLYPEHEEVDHVELIERLQTYDGWALSTDETNLAYVLSLCPPTVRVLAWCKPDAMPYPPNPWASWEPVICRPARSAGAVVRSYFTCAAPPRGFAARGTTLVGSKPAGFCEWVLRCMGAERGDALHDLFPGTGIMGATWDRFRTQPALWPEGERSFGGDFNRLRRTHPQLPGMPEPVVHGERRSA
jgi:hypothetical protein